MRRTHFILLFLLAATPRLVGSSDLGITAPSETDADAPVAVSPPEAELPAPRLLLVPPEISLPGELTENYVVNEKDKRYVPPRLSELPANAWGEQVKYGRRLFVDTQRYAKRLVGNGLNCSNCHLGEGRALGASPLWAGYPLYPLYRGKNLRANTYAERIGECFRYSMAGMAPTIDSSEMKALIAYSQWLSTSVPTRTIMAARGIPGANAPREASPEHGRVVYASQCAVCHGKNGEGVRRADGVGYQFPPLWGNDSYASGSGMNKLGTGAGFIKANMPLGKGGSLSAQDAMDVSFYLTIQDRPWDPRMGWFSILMGRIADG